MKTWNKEYYVWGMLYNFTIPDVGTYSIRYYNDGNYYGARFLTSYKIFYLCKDGLELKFGQDPDKTFEFSSFQDAEEACINHYNLSFFK